MAATKTQRGSTIEITGIDADWDMGEDLRIGALTFYPHAANDVMSVKDGSDTGPHIMRHLEPTQYKSHTIQLNGAKKRIYIDQSECTLNASSSLIIHLWPSRR